MTTRSRWLLLFRSTCLWPLFCLKNFLTVLPCRRSWLLPFRDTWISLSFWVQLPYCVAPPQELEGKHPDGLPRLDPVEDVGIDDPELVAAAKKVAILEHRLAANALHASTSDSNKKCVASWRRRQQSSARQQCPLV